MKKRIMIVEDEEFIRDILIYSLEKEGYEVIEAADGRRALEKIGADKIDCMLLDVMLPDTDGFTLYNKIQRLKDIPVIFLTARNDISDKLEGLKAGAEDYITKPFDIREVLARIEVVLRRGERGKKEPDNIIRVNENISINKKSHMVIMNQEQVYFKPKEYDLFLTLVENRNTALSRERLLEEIWGTQYEGDFRTVDVHIQRIRKKINDTKEDKLIQTVFGVGYRMN